MSAAQCPVPILLLGADAAVELHYLVSAKISENSLAAQWSAQRVVQLDKVALPAEQIHRKLPLEQKSRDKMVESENILRSEHQFMVFEKVDTVLIYIHLQCGVERMAGEFVVVGKGDYVVAERSQGVIHCLRAVTALIEDAVNLGVSMEIGPFPIERNSLGAECVQGVVRVIDAFPAETLLFREVIHGTYRTDGCHQKHKEQQSRQTESKAQKDLSYHHLVIFSSMLQPSSRGEEKLTVASERTLTYASRLPRCAL